MRKKLLLKRKKLLPPKISATKPARKKEKRTGKQTRQTPGVIASAMASSCGNLTPRVGENLSKSQRNEKKESNEKALRENFDTLEKKIAEKEGIDVSDNVKVKPKILKREK